MPGCPTCGGSERRLLSAGWFECTSPVLVDAPIVYDQAAAAHRPAGPPTMHPCGSRYQEGLANGQQPPCWCGVFAIGHCTGCKRPVCGVHSTQVPELLCGTCWDAWDAQQRRQQAEDQTAAREALAVREAAELAGQRQAEQARQDRLSALPPANRGHVQQYLAHGKGQIAPIDWSLLEGVRLEPVPFAVLPELLIAANYRPPRGTYPPRFRLLRGPNLSSYWWPLTAHNAGESANGRRWEWTRMLAGDGQVVGCGRAATHSTKDTMSTLSDLFTLAARRYSD